MPILIEDLLIEDIALEVEKRVISEDRRKGGKKKSKRRRITDLNKKPGVPAVVLELIFKRTEILFARVYKQVLIERGGKVSIFDKKPKPREIELLDKWTSKFCKEEQDLVKERLISFLNRSSFTDTSQISEDIFSPIEDTRDYFIKKAKDGKILVLVENEDSSVSKLKQNRDGFRIIKPSRN